MLNEEGLSLQEFLRFKTPEYHGEEGDDPQYFLEETKKVVRRLSCSDARVIELVGMKMKNNAWDWARDTLRISYMEGTLPLGRCLERLLWMSLYPQQRDRTGLISLRS